MSQNIFSSYSSEELQQALSNNLFRSILDLMPTGIAVLKANRNNRNEIGGFAYTFANKAAEKITAQSLTGQSIFFDDDTMLFNSMVEVVQSGKPENFVYPYSGDTTRWMHYAISPFGDGVWMTFENITDRKNTAAELESVRQHYTEIQAISHTGSFEWNPVSNDFSWSEEMSRIHHFSAQENISKELFLKLIHSDDMLRISKKLEHYSKIPGSEDVIYKLRLKDGSVRHLAGRIGSVRGRDGKITTVYGLLHDITDRKNKEEELRQVSESLQKQSAGKEKTDAKIDNYQRIVSGSPYSIISIDRKGLILTWNAAAEKLYGYSTAQAVDRKVIDLIVPERYREEVNSVLSRLFSGETIEEFEAVKKCRGGHEINVLVSLVPLKDSHGRITGSAIISKDITERKQAEQKLIERHDSLMQAQALGQIGNFYFDMVSASVSWSDELYRMMGVQLGEPMNFENAISFYIAEDREKLSALSAASLLSGEGFEMEAIFIPRGQKQQRQIFIRTEITKDANGKNTGIKGIVQDITERKHAQQELIDIKDRLTQKATDRYEMLFNSILQGFCIIEMIWDEKGNPVDYRFLEVNPVFEKITGIVDGAGKTIREIEPRHEQHWFRIYGDIAKNKQPMHFEELAGALIGGWYEVHAFPLEEDNKIAVLFSDITQRKKSEESLRESEARQKFLLQFNDKIRGVYDAMEIQAIAANMLGAQLKVNNAHYDEVDGQYVYIHHSYTDGLPPLTGKFRQQDFGGKLIEGHRKGEIQITTDIPNDPEITDSEKKAFEAVGIGAYIAVPLVKDGQWVATLVVQSIMPRQWKAGEIELVREVSERTWAAVERARAEEALRKSKDEYHAKLENEVKQRTSELNAKTRELQSLNSELKTFTSVAANDYKDILETLYTNLEYIIAHDAKNFSNTGRANLRKAQASIQKMKLLTDDIVSFSRLQAIDANFIPTDLNAILQNVESELAERIESTKTTISKEQLPDLVGSPFLLELLFFHLIDNAIKFRDAQRPPEISIAYGISKDSHSQQQWHQISITDNGIGMPQDQSQKVFEMFYRIHDKKYRGSGIGLAICKKIMALHGGTMALESEPGRGTSICCFFPVQA